MHKTSTATNGRQPTHYFYFYVECAGGVTSHNDCNWILLFIDIDKNPSTGWYGYDYLVNRKSPTSGKVILEKNVGNRWE